MISQAQIGKVARRYHLDLIVLFGSRAKGHARASSDVDVAVRAFKPGWIGKRRVPRWKWNLDVIGAVSSAVDDRRDVDVAFLNRATPLFMFEVARYGKLLYERKSGDFAVFRSYAARRYDDNAKFFWLTRQYLEKHFGTPGPKTRRAKTGESPKISR